MADGPVTTRHIHIKKFRSGEVVVAVCPSPTGRCACHPRQSPPAGGIAIGAAFVATAPAPAALKKAYDPDNLFRLNPNITPAG